MDLFDLQRTHSWLQSHGQVVGQQGSACVDRVEPSRLHVDHSRGGMDNEASIAALLLIHLDRARVLEPIALSPEASKRLPTGGNAGLLEFS